jgi:hypothetical protein
MGYPINSIISYPLNGAKLSITNEKEITIRGWAVGEGLSGAKVEKVQVSLDNGKTWNDANIG